MSEPGEIQEEFTGTVVLRNGRYVFANDNGEEQHLSTANRGQDADKYEIDLKPYANERLKVSGVWEHSWIIEAKILEHSPASIP